MKVYIVIDHPRGEMSEILAVFFKEEDALAYKAKYKYPADVDIHEEDVR